MKTILKGLVILPLVKYVYMKRNGIIPVGGLSLFLILFVFAGLNGMAQTQELKGAWLFEQGARQHVVVMEDNYLTHAAFDKSAKEFVMTSGGPFQVVDKQLVVNVEFNSEHQEEVGETKKFPFSINAKTLTIDMNGNQVPLSRIDEGRNPLAGTWRMTGRVQDGKQSAMAGGARKTLKILSGSRFQWFAINPETKEFFGTGGGTYTFQDGKYTEQIEFFSRDSSRVGMSLSFEDKVDNKDWHHTGNSSQGAPIHEIWSKIN